MYPFAFVHVRRYLFGKAIGCTLRNDVFVITDGMHFSSAFFCFEIFVKPS